MSNTYIIKGSLSGIQQFNFNVKSDGAAKALRGRTLFIRAVEHCISELVCVKIPQSNVFDRGGGSFYIRASNDFTPGNMTTALEEIMEIILQDPLLNSSLLSINLCFVPFDNNLTFSQILGQLNQEESHQKLSLYSQISDNIRFFQPFQDPEKPLVPLEKEHYIFLAEAAVNYSSFHVEYTPEQPSSVTYKGVVCCGFSCRFINEPGHPSTKYFPHSIPVWTSDLLSKYDTVFERFISSAPEFKRPKSGDIIELQYFAEFAFERTGTSKLGILKLDIDNLGELFGSLAQIDHFTGFSAALQSFFKNKTSEILSGNFTQLRRNPDQDVKITKTYSLNLNEKIVSKFIPCYHTTLCDHTLYENIYPVFTGGDDSFFIGSWDAILEFALKFRQVFNHNSASWTRDFSLGNKPVTLSGSYQIIDSHYPVSEMARISNDELKKAKYYNLKFNSKGKYTKNNFSIFGYVLSWEKVNELVAIRDLFIRMILEFGEKRAFLQRIQSSFSAKENQYWIKLGKPFNPALHWRFLYQFRDIRNKDYFKFVPFIPFNKSLESIFFGNDNESFRKKYVISRFKQGSGLVYELPVAARLTEYLARETNEK